ncbi:MAG: undecaprenyldiphospho-muramoylpentapeptide beta-N-acetylglucosaminyltransferase [Phenylobacterium sp.]|jgi:UDP-N-acetylglucosamine--N-acetylmuramyl-(pentapeptide) pyrophosphoryl-undecaprenol N-acetylglucosamine transferase|uniref:undecaprenyldiphospho-muramoylpentapeptide beta-N-acetylglucosaminyltransferase n=1 Tax=Phenylobacterium sp. TaxID=1871053 RepID=UPI002A35C9AE|nr:undecaprenyldiphospho-muramoylpentapeptide beta-N-acetylglucosaminyltransferase [Phenylobacterium sp.]MDX9996453.1 undecaprenyldiphospho-muramoylpentapeptide beta-N-acetylglucosaminyltransferase [Phenylobacterium sp.]
MSKTAVVAAGGTGGHLFPAQALAEALAARGWRIVLATDERGAAYADKFPAQERIALSASTARPGDLIGLVRAGFAVGQGVLQARRAFRMLDPAVVVGFGGYPSLPALLAALSQKRPTVIHEQNSVLGRVNRFIAPRVDRIACAFPTLLKADAKAKARATVVGNPVRPEIRTLYDKAYEAPQPDGRIRILITGGSQGARLLSELVPEAIAKLPEPLRMALIVQQQTRPESMETARRIYRDALIEAEIAPFFRDMAGRLGAAHLVIGRAGASTCCELAVAGRPAILVPLKIATDDHQRHNARLLEEVGGAAVALEDEVTVDSMAGALNALLRDPARLARMAASAKSVAKPDAAEKLADLVEETAKAR